MRKIRRKAKSPRTPWNINTIKEEKKIMSDYGLRRKREIQIAREIIRNFRKRARELIAVKDKEKERILLDKLIKIGLLTGDKGLDDVLGLTIKDILDRRFQTRVFKKGLASTIKQSRQFIVHGHVAISGVRVSYPSYIVPLEEESKINFYNKELKKNN